MPDDPNVAYIPLWQNPDRRPNARPFETLTDDDTKLPVALPLEKFPTHSGIASSPDELENLLFLGKGTLESPILITLYLAITYFGWQNVCLIKE